MSDPARNADLLRAAYAAAEDLARSSVADGAGYVSPKAQIGQLSPAEWQKIVAGAVSGWIIERVAQAAREQIHHDNMVFVDETNPPAREIGKLTALLPTLGGFVEQRGLSDKPIGAWSKDDVLTFAWLAWKNGDVANQHFDDMDNEIPF